MLNGAGLFTYKTWVVLVVNVGKYTSPIEHLGKGIFGCKVSFRVLGLPGISITVDGSFEIRRVFPPVEGTVVYPMIYRVFFTSFRWFSRRGSEPSTVSLGEGFGAKDSLPC